MGSAFMSAAGVTFADFTTIGVGGAPDCYVCVDDVAHAVEQIQQVWSAQEQWFVLGGGSNLVVEDEGFRGTVFHMKTHGVQILDSSAEGERIRVFAGVSWDDFVAYTVDRGLVGLEALSGIPGSVGAAPVQNIGAYGSEVGEFLVGVEFLDALSGKVVWLSKRELELGYRDSVFKRTLRGVILSVEVELAFGHTVGSTVLSAPIKYAQLAQGLGVEVGGCAPIDVVRQTVLELRSVKGMCVDVGDPESRSCGSFFMNPVVSKRFALDLPADAPQWVQESAGGRSQVKLSAAWLIEQCGLVKGFSLPGSRVSLSRKHVLAIVNRGGATCVEVFELAAFVQARVLAQWGVRLIPEPLFLE